jgi:hypothetical protein
MSRYSKSDYERVAKVIGLRYVGHNGDNNPDVAAALMGVASDMSDMFADDSPRFDRSRFLGAVESYRNLPRIPLDEI